MAQEDRKNQIREEIKLIISQCKSLRERQGDLNRELDFIKGNYDRTWEEEYGGNE